MGIYLENWFIDSIYLISVLFFIFGLKKLSSPRTARAGNFYSMFGMFLAVVITLFSKKILSIELIAIGIAVGAVIGILMARIVAMTSMPQMVA